MIAFISLSGFYVGSGSFSQAAFPVVAVKDKAVLDVNGPAFERGVRAGMTLREAKAILHDAKYVEWNPDEYREAQRVWLDVCTEFTDVIEPEEQHSAYLDLSAHPDPGDVLRSLVDRVQREVWGDLGCRVSGVGCGEGAGSASVSRASGTIEGSGTREQGSGFRVQGTEQGSDAGTSPLERGLRRRSVEGGVLPGAERRLGTPGSASVSRASGTIEGSGIRDQGIDPEGVSEGSPGSKTPGRGLTTASPLQEEGGRGVEVGGRAYSRAGCSSGTPTPKPQTPNPSGIAVHTGVARVKWLAKTALQTGDVDQLAYRYPKLFLDKLPTAMLTPVSPEHRERLGFLGYKKAGQVVDLPLEVLQSQFGEEGLSIHRAVRGGMKDKVKALYPLRCASARFSFESPVESTDALERGLAEIAERLSEQLRANDLQGCDLEVRVGYEDDPEETLARNFAKPMQSSASVQFGLKLVMKEYLAARQPSAAPPLVIPNVRQGFPTPGGIGPLRGLSNNEGSARPMPRPYGAERQRRGYTPSPSPEHDTDQVAGTALFDGPLQGPAEGDDGCSDAPDDTPPVPSRDARTHRPLSRGDGSALPSDPDPCSLVPEPSALPADLNCPSTPAFRVPCPASLPDARDALALPVIPSCPIAPLPDCPVIPLPLTPDDGSVPTSRIAYLRVRMPNLVRATRKQGNLYTLQASRQLAVAEMAFDQMRKAYGTDAVLAGSQVQEPRRKRVLQVWKDALGWV